MIETLLANAVLACPLAVVAWLVGRRAQSPALVHAVWLIVLLKLVSPPLIELPLGLPFATEGSTDAEASVVDTEQDGVTGGGLPPGFAAELAAELALLREARDLTARPVEEAADASEPATETGALVWSVRVLLGIWGIGSLALAILAAGRMRRFGRLLATGEPAPRELRRKLRRLATRIGLRRTPRTIVVDARVSPMVWGCGPSTTLVLPSELESVLSRRELETLLLHELAHLKRRDHWVRFIELAAAIVYWWNPVLWLCRRELRRTEEECCDAWVVSTLPGEGREYARALVTCIDFVAGVPRPVAPGASAMGAAGLMKRRVEMILRPSARAGLDPRLRVALVLLALVSIPVLPVLAQDAPPAPEVVVEDVRSTPLIAREVPLARPTAVATTATDDEIDAVIALLTAAIDDIAAGGKSPRAQRVTRRLRSAIERLQARRKAVRGVRLRETRNAQTSRRRVERAKDEARRALELQMRRLDMEAARQEQALKRNAVELESRMNDLESMRRDIELRRLELEDRREVMRANLERRRKELELSRRDLEQARRREVEGRRLDPKVRAVEEGRRRDVDVERRRLQQQRRELQRESDRLSRELKRLKLPKKPTSLRLQDRIAALSEQLAETTARFEKTKAKAERARLDQQIADLKSELLHLMDASGQLPAVVAAPLSEVTEKEEVILEGTVIDKNEVDATVIEEEVIEEPVRRIAKPTKRRATKTPRRKKLSARSAVVPGAAPAVVPGVEVRRGR